MKRSSGFSLMEAVVSIALFGMVMFLMAQLMSAASASERFLGEKERVQEVALSALYRMAHEARTANHWITPPSSGAAQEMVFEAPDLFLENKEFPTATPYPASWKAADPNYQVTIRYFVEPGTSQLMRTLTAGGESWTTAVVRDCQSLRVNRISSVHLALSLTVLSKGTPHENTVQVLLPEESWKPQ